MESVPVFWGGGQSLAIRELQRGPGRDYEEELPDAMPLDTADGDIAEDTSPVALGARAVAEKQHIAKKCMPIALDGDHHVLARAKGLLPCIGAVGHGIRIEERSGILDRLHQVTFVGPDDGGHRSVRLNRERSEQDLSDACPPLRVDVPDLGIQNINWAELNTGQRLQCLFAVLGQRMHGNVREIDLAADSDGMSLALMRAIGLAYQAMFAAADPVDGEGMHLMRDALYLAHVLAQASPTDDTVEGALLRGQSGDADWLRSKIQAHPSHRFRACAAHIFDERVGAQFMALVYCGPRIPAVLWSIFADGASSDDDILATLAEASVMLRYVQDADKAVQRHWEHLRQQPGMDMPVKRLQVDFRDARHEPWIQLVSGLAERTMAEDALRAVWWLAGQTALADLYALRVPSPTGLTPTTLSHLYLLERLHWIEQTPSILGRRYPHLGRTRALPRLVAGLRRQTTPSEDKRILETRLFLAFVRCYLEWMDERDRTRGSNADRWHLSEDTVDEIRLPALDLQTRTRAADLLETACAAADSPPAMVASGGGAALDASRQCAAELTGLGHAGACTMPLAFGEWRLFRS